MHEVGDPVWVFQAFRARQGEVRTKKLTHSWHGPYRTVARVNENVYPIDIPTHPRKTVTVNVNRMKKYRGKWTRPYVDEVPVGLGSEVEGGEVEPLAEVDLPPSRFAERLTLGGEYTIIAGVHAPLVEFVAKKGGLLGFWRKVVQEVLLTASVDLSFLAEVGDELPMLLGGGLGLVVAGFSLSLTVSVPSSDSSDGPAGSFSSSSSSELSSA
ncbi:unnamed protein product [Phytophthora fragariaefolia]|uniref:Unnamed protein product n=1 Tax=Phytophthora fragariaefolia TaxID=1490495 RepID=A0A9W6U395_9STRA|nr:unnamed protein product [Phytophthora fragariaefolia]